WDRAVLAAGGITTAGRAEKLLRDGADVGLVATAAPSDPLFAVRFRQISGGSAAPSADAAGLPARGSFPAARGFSFYRRARAAGARSRAKSRVLGYARALPHRVAVRAARLHGRGFRRRVDRARPPGAPVSLPTRQSAVQESPDQGRLSAVDPPA